MDKIVEEAMTNLIRRVDDLEEKIKNLDQKPQFNKSPGLATSGQLWKIKNEGGTPWNGITKIEATKEIDRLLKEKVTNSDHQSPSVTEPSEVEYLADETGIDEEGLM